MEVLRTHRTVGNGYEESIIELTELPRVGIHAYYANQNKTREKHIIRSSPGLQSFKHTIRLWVVASWTDRELRLLQQVRPLFGRNLAAAQVDPDFWML